MMIKLWKNVMNNPHKDHIFKYNIMHVSANGMPEYLGVTQLSQQFREKNHIALPIADGVVPHPS